MIDSDYEWLLRRWAEDELLARGSSSLHTRASALAAVGVLSRDSASDVLAQYTRARSLRGLDVGHWSPDDVPALAPVRAYRCSAVIEQAWGTTSLQYLATSRSGTRIEATISDMTNPATSRRGHYLHHGPPSVPITDSTGKRHTAGFNGGGSDTEWTGRWMITPGLSADVEWITFCGVRIPLEAAPSDVVVSVEALGADSSAQERALRHLERLIEVHTHRFDSDLEVAVDTYVEIGLLDGESEAIAQVFAIQDALRGGGPVPAGMSERWRSVLKLRGRGGGPIAHRVIGVTTPIFDGVQLSLLGLSSTDTDVEVSFEAGGRLAAPHGGSPFHQALGVTGVDDLGNHYLGRIGQFGSGSDGMEGTYMLGAPLDPSAAMLELRFSGDTTRAVVRIPLRWDEPS